MALYIQITTDK